MMREKWVVGVDLGGTTTKLAFINVEGEIIEKWEIETDHSDAGKNITANIAKSIDQKLKEQGETKDKLIGVGMGSPGPVNYKAGILYNAVNLPWEDHYPLKKNLEEAIHLPALIDNDANCAALGEMWKGAGNGAKDLVCVTLGTGVGGGVITNGKIVQGVSGAAGEIGHITVIPDGGAPCNCGKTGCLETVASATGIVRLANLKLKEEGLAEGLLVKIYEENGSITAKDVFDCAKLGDAACLEIIDEVAFYLGLVLANLGNTLNPEKIVLGGGVSKAGDILLDKVQSYFDKYAFSRVKDTTKISIATLGNDAGVIGAGWLVMNEQFQ